MTRRESAVVHAGIDIGSRSIELVVLDGEDVVLQRREDTTYEPLVQCEKILADVTYAALGATGYGRKLLAQRRPCAVVTEIQAYALGAAHVYPRARTVLDIGGQDTKAILLTDQAGRPARFEMNDRCAAGTGKFLEFMATGLQVPLPQFGDFALSGRPGLELSSMCTVFAESEATSLMARGHDARDIARAMHRSVVMRSLAMLRRVGVEPPVVFAGGVARNPCMVTLLAEALGVEVWVPPAPEMIGALGAALFARRLAVAKTGD